MGDGLHVYSRVDFHCFEFPRSLPNWLQTLLVIASHASPSTDGSHLILNSSSGGDYRTSSSAPSELQDFASSAPN